jgi:hypothetical protein
MSEWHEIHGKILPAFFDFVNLSKVQTIAWQQLRHPSQRKLFQDQRDISELG